MKPVTIKTMVAVATLAAAALTPSAPPEEGIQGVWKSTGYGRIIEITKASTGKRAMTLYNVTGLGCLKDESKPEVSDAAGIVSFGDDGDREFTVRAEGDHAFLRVLGTLTDIRLTRLDQPSGCPSELPENPKELRERTFQTFWKTLEENYPPYEHRRVNWARQATDLAALRAENTEAKLTALLTSAVEELGDMHTGVSKGTVDKYGLRPGTREEVDEKAVKAAVEKRLGTRLTKVIKGVEYATGLPGGVGYLRITQFDEFGDSFDGDVEAFGKALDTVFAKGQQDHWSGLILDLRLNEGGHDVLGLELASRLATGTRFAFQKRGRDHDGFTPFERFTVEPSKRPGFTGKLALLVSDLTVSAAETASMAIANRTPLVIGRPTQGVFSDQITSPLPGGWEFQLSNEEYRTENGTSYEGLGVPVAVAKPVFEAGELKGGCDSAIAEAMDRLTGRPPGTTKPCLAR